MQKRCTGGDSEIFTKFSRLGRSILRDRIRNLITRQWRQRERGRIKTRFPGFWLPKFTGGTDANRHMRRDGNTFEFYYLSGIRSQEKKKEKGTTLRSYFGEMLNI